MTIDTEELIAASGADKPDALEGILAQSDFELTQEALAKALEEASFQGRPSNVRLLLRRGATITEKSITLAVYMENVEIWRVFLENGWDPGRRVDLGHRKVHPLGLVPNKPKLLQFLLDQGADINTVIDDEGRTVLDYAAQEKSLDHARFLLEHGARPSPNTFHHALSGYLAGGVPMLELLIEAGADVNAVSPAPYGTVLHEIIITRGPEDVKEAVLALMDAGADPTVRVDIDLHGTRGNMSALELAATREDFVPGLYKLMVDKLEQSKVQSRE